MVQAGTMSYASTVACAARLLCLIAIPFLTSPNAHGESDARESQQRLSTSEYARRSRLASAQNPLPRIYSYFGDTTLPRTNLLIYRDNKGAVLPVDSVRDWSKR